jgi:hypothetical protein
MLHLFTLLLPGLIPSWEFFKAIEPSPRVQWRLRASHAQDNDPWQEFRPRPAHLPWWVMLRRLFWNPRWNDTLYLVSLSERLMLSPTAHSEDEIFACLAKNAMAMAHPPAPQIKLQFRLIFQSEPRPLSGLVP